MSFLQITWFVLIAILWSGFFFLEGYDFGIGMQFVFNSRNQKDRQALYEAIGPHWDANEVWLITAGGAMFAAFSILVCIIILRILFVIVYRIDGFDLSWCFIRVS